MRTITSKFVALCLVLMPLAAWSQATAQSGRIIRISSSADTVSGFSETPAGDHLIPGSQIYVGGRGGATKWLSLIGVIIDASRNEAAAAGAQEALKIKFDQLLMPMLAALQEGNAIPEAKFVAAEDAYDAKLLPSARFHIMDDGRALVMFRLTARLRLDPNASETTKNYQYAPPGLRPLMGEGGWIENDAALVREMSKQAFTRLVEAFANDTAGRFNEPAQPEKQRFVTLRATSGEKPKAVLLGESHEVVFVMPIFNNRQIRQVVQVLDRAVLDPSVPIESAR